MKRFSTRKLIIIPLVLLLSIACSFGARATPTVDNGAVATSVAATVQGMAKQGEAEAKPAVQLTEVPPVSVPAQASTPRIEEKPAEKPALVVAYTDGSRNLWAWAEGETSRELVNTGNVTDVCISSDGKLAVFTRVVEPAHYSLWAIGADGSNLRELVNQTDMQAIPSDPEGYSIAPAEVKFIPGSHSVLFNTRPLYEGPGMARNDDLWMLNADTGEKRNLFARGQGGAFFISPDGKQITLSTPQSVSLLNTDGSNLRKDILKFEHILTYSEYSFYPEPRWSADSKTVRVVIPATAALENPTQPTKIWNIPLDGSPAAQIGSVVTAPLNFAQLSPDLAKVAYMTNFGKPEENRRDLNIANADGSGSSVIQTGQLALAGWVPDSIHVAYTDNASQASYLIQAGSGAVLMPGGNLVGSPFWLDGSRYLALFRAVSGWEFRLGTLDGGSTVIASTPIGDGTSWPVLSTNLNIP